jgi:hypothetical protein
MEADDLDSVLFLHVEPAIVIMQSEMIETNYYRARHALTCLLIDITILFERGGMRDQRVWRGGRVHMVKCQEDLRTSNLPSSVTNNKACRLLQLT